MCLVLRQIFISCENLQCLATRSPFFYSPLHLINDWCDPDYALNPVCLRASVIRSWCDRTWCCNVLHKDDYLSMACCIWTYSINDPHGVLKLSSKIMNNISLRTLCFLILKHFKQNIHHDIMYGTVGMLGEISRHFVYL